MENPRIVSIDLGSAYTKLALREGWNARSLLLHDLPLSTRELTYCVPSVVAKVRRDGEDKWLIGAPASAQLPGDGVRIYRNWKASLFRDGPIIPNAPIGSDLSEDEVTTVAAIFFSNLRSALVETSSQVDLTKLPVRICIPRFSNFSTVELLLKEILTKAGWSTAKTRLAIAEPEANALGVMSRGLNQTWIPGVVDFQRQPGRCPNMPKMIEAAGLLDALHRMSGYYGVLVIDIGAFTTDFGYVRFDATFADDSLNRPAITQQSYPLGIRNLDGAVFSRLSLEAQKIIRERATTADWESLKPALYRGDEVAIRNPRGGVMYLGRGKEAQAIKDTVLAFAERIWTLRSEFLSTLSDSTVHAQTLTGGGSLIPAIRNTLTSRVRVVNGVPVRDLLEEASGAVSSREMDDYARRTRELIRGGSAIGGTSVFFE